MSFSYTIKQQQALNLTGQLKIKHMTLGGGSRSGKTFLFLVMIILRALKAPNSDHAVLRFRFNALRSSVIAQTLPAVMRLRFPELIQFCRLDKSEWVFHLPNKSRVWFAGLDGGDRTEKILGMEFSTLFFNECSQVPWPSRTLAMTRLSQSTNNILSLKAFYDFNPPSMRHWTYRLFIEHKSPDNDQLISNPDNYAYMTINPADNIKNLSPEYLAGLDELPEADRNRFKLGLFSSEADGALWSVELFAATRFLGKTPMPDLLEIVVAVDPSGCDGLVASTSNEVGIVVVGLGVDQHIYVLEDLSGQYAPEQWGAIAVDAYYRRNADYIVGEVNYGGDMVRAVIHAIDSDVPFVAVTASRGKVVRATPVAVLYERGKVHHVGHFAKLEAQACAMTIKGYKGTDSPDRVDALVWAITKLSPSTTTKNNSNWAPPEVVSYPLDARIFDL